MPKINQTTKQVHARAIVAGIDKRLPRDETYYLDGKRYSHAELKLLFAQQIDALDAIRSARAALAVALVRERKAAQQVSFFTPRLRTYVGHRFAFGPDVLADFGWTPAKKPGPKTAAAKAQGALKAKATRIARRTMGKRQREKIQGHL